MIKDDSTMKTTRPRVNILSSDEKKRSAIFDVSVYLCVYGSMDPLVCVSVYGIVDHKRIDQLRCGFFCLKADIMVLEQIMKIIYS